MKSKPLLPLDENRKNFTNAEDAVSYVQKIFHDGRLHLQENWQRFVEGKQLRHKVSAYYPYVAITVDWKHVGRQPKRMSHGFVSYPGRHVATLTRPFFFEKYYKTQLAWLLKNHKVPIEVGVSSCPIPIDYAFVNGLPGEETLTLERYRKKSEYFDLINLRHEEDNAGSGHMLAFAGGNYSLSLFSAPHVDSSLRRLVHYTGTDPKDFQRFVIFTNFDDYVIDFKRTALEIMSPDDDPAVAAYRRQYTRLVGPGGCITYNANNGDKNPENHPVCRISQMPTYHLCRDDGAGITLINIGVGPSNAKNITDHLAVLRPDATLMLGHAAGLSPELEIGDYILAQAYLRRDKILDDKVPTDDPVPPLSEVQQAIEAAVRQITKRNRKTVKTILRTGTVICELDRNWERGDIKKLERSINASRAIALDMESGTIAANCFRWCVPYGTLLINSDMPLIGRPKMPGPAGLFFQRQVSRHMQIGIRAMEILRKDPNLHSRKLKPPLFGRAFL
ncbi:MAG: AMP nucleosidase [Alphaproteobacteria bacterium]|nr:AMP nucleosidase [Alphaproteobacteria bacterium]